MDVGIAGNPFAMGRGCKEISLRRGSQTSAAPEFSRYICGNNSISRDISC